MRPSAKLASVLLFILVAGCAGRRLVRTDAAGGVVAIPNNSNYWPTYYRDKAEEMIRQRCPNGYEIVGEEEVVTGTVTNTSTQTNTKQAPELLLGGGSKSTDKNNGSGGNTSSAFGGVALPVGDTQQTTQRTMTSTNVTEWRIQYRAKQRWEPGEQDLGTSQVFSPGSFRFHLSFRSSPRVNQADSPSRRLTRRPTGPQPDNASERDARSWSAVANRWENRLGRKG